MGDKEKKTSDFLSPQGLIEAASKSHPAFKFAICAAGLASLVAVVASFGISYATLVFGVIVLLAIMVIFLVFSQATVLARTKMRLPALVLVWSVLGLVILVAAFLVTSAFFDVPLPLKTAIITQFSVADAFEDEDMDQTPWPENPKVLFMTPGDTGYGKLHEHGLRKALENSLVSIVTCYSEFKNVGDDGYDHNDLKRIKGELDSLLEKNDIIAVVGPCLVAITRDVVEYILSINPDVPIILESPITRAELGHPDGKPFGQLKPPHPVYRISSGIDERIPHLGNLIHYFVKNNAKLSIILEDTPYGESLKKGALAFLARIPEFQLQQVPVVPFGRSDNLDLIKPMFENDVVFYFGTGARYAEIAKAHVKPENNILFVGLMNAWVFNDITRNESMLKRLIDLEDIEELGPSKQRTAPQVLFENAFKSVVSPNVRDQAFSYDAGLCVNYAWEYATQNKPTDGGYRNCLTRIRKYLERPEGHECVTGIIIFPEGGGQNRNLERNFVLNRAVPDNDTKMTWVTVTADEIIKEWRQASTPPE